VALGLKEIRLLSNNPEKVAAIEDAGVKVIERVPCEIPSQEHMEKYLKTKQEKLGHLFGKAGK
jgi:GTP cyclohydrolase II